MQIFVEPKNRQNKGHVKYFSPEKEKKDTYSAYVVVSRMFFPTG